MCLMEAKKVESGSRDAISCLPDDILAKILSFLPTKRAVTTSLLSKRWRNLFPLMIHLFASQHRFDFDDSDLLCPECKREGKDVHQSFMDFVDKTIFVCNSMEKLSLKCQDGLISFELTKQWICNALDRGVVDLDLRLKTSSVPKAKPNLLPPSLFMNKTLVKLTLGLDVSVQMPFTEVYLPVLKSLFLHSVWFINEGLCRRLLPGSPILEELFLHHLPGERDPPINRARTARVMMHKTLKRLTFHYNNSVDFSRFMTFYIPSLVYLDYSGLAPFRNSKADFEDSLVEAKLDVDVQQTYSVFNHLLTIISLVRNVKTLSLSSTSVKAMYSHCEELPFFFNLVKLCFESNTEQGWEVLPRLFNKSPKLETLVLKGLHCVGNKGVYIDDKNEMKVVEIYGFRGSGRELRQVECYLCQMHFLQVMKVEIDDDADADADADALLLDQLLALPKRSSKCKIQFL